VPAAFVAVDAAFDLIAALGNALQDEMSFTTPEMLPTPVPVHLCQGIVN
jgi:hypothetical protein